MWNQLRETYIVIIIFFLKDEMVLLSVLSNILVSLEPFTRGHRDLFADEVLAPFLDGVQIKSDEDRIKVSSVINLTVFCIDLVYKAYLKK